MTTTADASTAEPLTKPSKRRRAPRIAFRNWRRSRPFWAGLWAMLGGVFIAYVPGTALKFVLIANASIVIGTLVGAVIGFFGLMLWFSRSLRILLGVLILLLSLASFFTSDFGGLFVGMLMGLIGGSLALAWVPTKTTWRQRRRARKLAQAGGSSTEAPAPAPAPAESLEPSDEGQPEDERVPELVDDIFGPDAAEPPAGAIDARSHD